MSIALLLFSACVWVAAYSLKSFDLSIKAEVYKVCATGQKLKKTSYAFVSKVSSDIQTACNGFVSMLRQLYASAV
jgi:ABC-type oligopeptide transport system ATPase subunit